MARGSIYPKPSSTYFDVNNACLNVAIRIVPCDDKFYGLICYKCMYVRLMLMNGTNNQEVIKDCTKIYEKVLEWERKIEKKYPFDHNDNVWRKTVKSQLSQFVSLASIGKKERNLTDPTKCTVCRMSGVKISKCGRCKKTWYVTWMDRVKTDEDLIGTAELSVSEQTGQRTNPTANNYCKLYLVHWCCDLFGFIAVWWYVP